VVYAWIGWSLISCHRNIRAARDVDQLRFAGARDRRVEAMQRRCGMPGRATTVRMSDRATPLSSGLTKLKMPISGRSSSVRSWPWSCPAHGREPDAARVEQNPDVAAAPPSSRPWSGRTGCFARPTGSCARLALILPRRNSTAGTSHDHVHRQSRRGIWDRAESPGGRILVRAVTSVTMRRGSCSNVSVRWAALLKTMRRLKRRRGDVQFCQAVQLL
jgi:hypothetical protein